MKKKGILILFDCNNISETNYKKMKGYVSEYRQEKAEKYYHYHDKVLSVVAEFSLFYLMRKYYCIDRRMIKILRQDKGKPFFKEGYMPKFNLSHTNNLTAVLVANCEVGIDVENINSQTQKSLKQIMEFVFSNEEIAKIESEKEDMVNQFFKTWTYREAYYKMMGKGLSVSDFKKNIPRINDSFSFDFNKYCISICGILEDDVKKIVMDEKNIVNMCEFINEEI